ncbi:double-CXXCG motif protein [Pyxidicoccus sp. 3LG]
MRYYKLSEPHLTASRTWTGTCRVERRWGLPGVECPKCFQTWSWFRSYPAVDVSQLPERGLLEDPWPKPYAEYARLMELVRPHCPPDVTLTPGSMFGPLHGTARGRFGPLTRLPLWGVLVREDLLQALQAEQMKGIVPVPPVFKKPPSPALVELHLLPAGKLHPDCILSSPVPPCALCGRDGRSVHPAPWLDAASLPTGLDVFHPEDAPMLILVSERFVEIAQGCGVSDVVFTEVATAPGDEASRA